MLKQRNLFYIIAFLIVISMVTIKVPFLVNSLPQQNLVTIPTWDGTSASAFAGGSGTETDPYQIANAGELLFYQEQLLDPDYKDKYYVLTNNIVLNDGLFGYDEEGFLYYNLNQVNYYLKPYTNEYYDNLDYQGVPVGNINIFEALDDFSGHFDGAAHTIYGLYLTGEEHDQLALFTNLTGNISNLYLENTLVYGGTLTAGLASVATDAKITNILIKGYLISEDIDNEIVGGIVGSGSNLEMTNVVNEAFVKGSNISGGLIGEVVNELELNQAYNSGYLISEFISGGLIGEIKAGTEAVLISKCYNQGLITGVQTGGLIGVITERDAVNIEQVFNIALTTHNIYEITTGSSVELEHVYYINDDDPVGIGVVTTGTFELVVESVFKDKDYVLTNLEFEEYKGEVSSSAEVWLYQEDSLPLLYPVVKMTTGYIQTSLFMGRNDFSYQNLLPNLSGQSLLTLKFKDQGFIPGAVVGANHYLKTNFLLPMGTKIILIDEVKGKTYEYQILTEEDLYQYEASCENETNCLKVASYPFTLFKEVGTLIKTIPFSEDSTSDLKLEEFTIILDFKEATITTNYQALKLYLEVIKATGEVIKTTNFNTIKSFNLYSHFGSETVEAEFYLETEQTALEIMHNQDAVINIDLESGIHYQKYGDLEIIDTRFEGQDLNLGLMLVDSDDNIMPLAYMKNMIFRLDEKNYYPCSDHIIRFALNNGLHPYVGTLAIITYETNSFLTPGTYYIKIFNYLSEGGYEEATNLAEAIVIPVIITPTQAEIELNFNVEMLLPNRVIEKEEPENEVEFKVLQTGVFEEPYLTVALYQKEELTAYNQDYSLVDLLDYISNDLKVAVEGTYYVEVDQEQTFKLELDKSKFLNTSYKLVFTLGDESLPLMEVEKYFIVKGEAEEEEDEYET